MTREDLITDLSTFISRTLEPSECLSRMMRTAHDGIFDQPKVELYDVGTVTASLTALAKLQLQSLSDYLECQHGPMNVVFSDDNLVPVAVTDIEKRE